MRAAGAPWLALALPLLLGCGAPELPVLGTVPPFSLTDRSGRTVTQADLSGRVWVADFIFTRCPDVCPALTQRMALLQEMLTPPADPIRLVSISVDPGHDTPEVLDAYARRMGAREHWLFLTGPREAVVALLRDGFKVAFAEGGPPSAPITHSDRFVLVDRQGRVRGYYHGTDADDVARLERDAAALQRERAA